MRNITKITVEYGSEFTLVNITSDGGAACVAVPVEDAPAMVNITGEGNEDVAARIARAVIQAAIEAELGE